MKRPVLLLLVTAACGPYSYVRQAEPNPMAGQSVFMLGSLMFNHAEVDGMPEDVWIAGQNDGWKSEWPGDQGRASGEFAGALKGKLASRGITVTPQANPQGATLMIKPTVAVPGYQAFAAPILRRDGVRHGNVVLTRLPIASARRICLDFERREPRTAVEVRLDTGARPLRVVATHLGLMPGERRFQVKLISSHIAEEEQSITVLLGDFNEWFLAGRPLRWLQRRFGPSRAVRTFPSFLPLFALDRIWVHPKGLLARCAAVDTALARKASDHLPIVAELCVSGSMPG